MEVWKDIQGYEGFYQVSNFGEVKSLDRYLFTNNGKKRKFIGKQLKKDKSNCGYFRVQLWKNQIKKSESIHRLVAFAFINNIDNKTQVNHKNGLKSDNCVENLEWSTSSENMQHSYDNGFNNGPKGEKNGQSKLNEENVFEIRKMLDLKIKQIIIAKNFGVSISTISHIKTGKKWIK